MMKVRILDQCEFCDGEVSMREARRLTTIDLAICGMAVVWGEGKNLREFSDFHYIPHIKRLRSYMMAIIKLALQ